MNKKQISQRLDEAEVLLTKLKHTKEQAEAKNIPTDYPTVAMTVLENFIPYTREDLACGEMTWVESASDEIVQLGRDALAQMERLLTDDGKPHQVPRYRTSPIRIEGASFTAEAEWTGICLSLMSQFPLVISKPNRFITTGQFSIRNVLLDGISGWRISSTDWRQNCPFMPRL